VTEAELQSAYEAQKPLLAAWGNMVKESVLSRLEKAPGLTKPLEEFLKIPVEPRVKATDSFLAKALKRGKDYERPLDQITDKVGVRFVVLLLSELKIIEDVIEGCELWEAEKARDFETERAERPHHFDYQWEQKVTDLSQQIQTLQQQLTVFSKSLTPLTKQLNSLTTLSNTLRDS
jgi:hypothetical protein